ncbi:cytochrome P450 [Streptomyces smyrnaeus]|uniref:cytochrome P450 family protein n=1 Tax=Streptomyces smyrnaeus TaxID=1387713 RepID=UPI0033AFC2A9
MTTKHLSHGYLLTAHELLHDPYGGFNRLREENPIAQGNLNGSTVWIITRHDDVSAVLNDRRFVTNSGSVPGRTDEYAEVLEKMGIEPDLIPYLAGELVRTDPPEHTRLRKLVTRAFSARRVRELRPRVEALTDQLLTALPDHAAEDGSVDFIAHFAHPLPIMVICELLGVPRTDVARWQGWGSDYMSMEPRRLNTMLTEVAAYIGELADRRRAEPTDDLLTGLVQARDGDGRLSDTELVTMVLALMIAGYPTTSQLLGNGLVALLTHPDQLALLREDPGLMPGAVQELLRWCGPAVVSKLRYAAEDITLGGTLIRQGDCVQVVLGSANHDPGRYTDPGRLDVTRGADASGPHHFGYSQGIHYCLGAMLANQEAEVALTGLLGRYPDLALGVPEDRLEWKAQPLTRVLVRLPLSLGTARAV